MIFGNKFVWWTGVVEDRNDPEQLGRCKVRIFGFHTDDITLLPTADLPWAIPLQSITSAATSGVGHTPVGVVPGTWVVGWFLDGEEAQRPLIIGTIAGHPQKEPEAVKKQTQSKNNSTKGILRTSDGKPVVDQYNNPITTGEKIDRTEALYPLTSNDLKNIFSAISSKASGDDISKESVDGRLGKYQLSVPTLVSLGYIKRPSSDFALTAWTNTDSNWTGKDGITSKAQFLKSEAAQYNAVLSAAEANYKSLLLMGKITQQDDPKIIGSLLGTSLIMGTNNSDKLTKKTESGIFAKDYFIAVNAALGGSSDDFSSDIETAINYLADTNNNNYQGVLNNKELLKRRGFSDPNKEYPRYEYLGSPDVNKLALGDLTHRVFKVKENKKIEKIPLPNTTKTWDEPRASYGAAYPYNQVIETEAGHVIELDSTPNAERIHVFHKTGTYIEIDVNGSMVRKVIGDNYEIIDRNNFTYVKGAHNLTVEGKTNILVRNSADIVVEGDLSVTSHKDTSVSSSGTATVVGKNINLSGKDNINIVTEGSLNLQGKNINLYAKGGSLTQKSGQDFLMESGASSTFSIKGGQSLLMDAAIVKTKMGASSIREIAFAALPLPEAKTPSQISIPVLRRDVNPESTYLFDALEPGAKDYVNSLAANGEININIVPTVIPTETIPDNIVTKATSTTANNIVSTTKTTTTTTKAANIAVVTTKVANNTTKTTITNKAANVTTNTTVTTNVTTNTNITNKAANKTTTTAENATITSQVVELAKDSADAINTLTEKAVNKVKSYLPTSKW